MSPQQPTGLFFGSSTCYTDMVAGRIVEMAAEHHPQHSIQIHNIADEGLAALPGYRQLIFGIPTWDYGALQDDWDCHWDRLKGADFDGALAAIYGLGDASGYGEWFQDAMGYLAHQLQQGGARLTGRWPLADHGIGGYAHQSSRAIDADGAHFVGLALDEENQAELTGARLRLWLGDILA